MSRSNVLVTGADTPIGERLVRTLLTDSRIGQVLAVSQSPTDHIAQQAHRRLTVVQVDLRRSRRVHSLLFGPARDLNVDTVIHTSAARSAWARGRAVHAYNVDAFKALLELGERHPTIKSLVLRSDAGVYEVQKHLPILINESHPINMSRRASQWIRDRVETDMHACVQMGVSQLRIVVLRMAECLAPGTGSQLYDYLQSPLCLRPVGFDPMVNLISLQDATSAFIKATTTQKQGVFNVPGADTLPLTACIRRYGRIAIPAPESLINPMYRLRHTLGGMDFRYGMNRARFHYSGVLDGTRAREVLRYVPAHPLDWPGTAAEDALV